MKTALVIHNTLNSVGGAKRVCLAAIEALKKAGFKITLISTEPTDWRRATRIIDPTARPDREHGLLHVRNPFPIYWLGSRV